MSAGSCLAVYGCWSKRVTVAVTLLFSVLTMVPVHAAASRDPFVADRADKGDQPGLRGGLIIGPGKDLWITVDPTQVTFGGTSPFLPIPANFFYPGSLPFSSPIQLIGDPIAGIIDVDDIIAVLAAFGGADTIVERLAPASLPFDGATDTIPIELVQLSLRSTNPITVNPGARKFDVFVTREAAPASLGQMTIDRIGPDNGIFRCPLGSLTVFVHFRFREVGGGPDLHLSPPLPVQLGSSQLHPWATETNGFAPPGTGPNFYPRDQVYPVTGQGVSHPVRPPPPPDYHETWIGAPGSNRVQFGTAQNPSIPGGFFGPGSDPFVGQIDFDGKELYFPSYGSTSVILQRTADPVHPLDPGPGTMGTVPIEIMALSLTSVAPITVTYNGGLNPEQWKVDIGPSENFVQPAGSTITATKTHPNGGTYTSTIIVRPLLTFTNINGDERVLDDGRSYPMNSTGDHFVHQVNAVLSAQHYIPQGAQWVAGILENLGTQTVVPADEVATGMVTHTVCPPRRPPPPPDYHRTWIGFPFLNEVIFGGANPAIPAGFFGPGSVPFIGTVAYQGDRGDIPVVYWADTLTRRPRDPFAPSDLPPAGPVDVPIEIVALSLVSVNPITVTYNNGNPPEKWRMDISPSVLWPQPLGSLSVRKTHANGGTFDSNIPVRTHFTFTRNNDLAERLMDNGQIFLMSSTGDHWVHTVDPSLDIYVPAGANFVPGVRDLGGIQTVVPIDEVAPGMVIHTVCPPPPPPPPPDYHATWISDDLLNTDGTQFTFGGAGSPPIPAGFFGPGSLPFQGLVAWVYDSQGEIQPQVGNSSVITRRPRDPVQPADAVGTMGTVPIEIVALSLRSIEPIVVNYSDGHQQLWDVQAGTSWVTPPPGSMTAEKTHLNGGTWDAVLPVQARFTFTCVGPGGGCSPRILDTGVEGQQPIQFQTTGQPFVHQAAPHIMNEYYIDPAARFVPGIDETNQGDPTSQVPVVTDMVDSQFPARHRICPPRRIEPVCIWRVTCADGACDLCPLCTGDECQLDRCPGPNPTCATPTIDGTTTCGPDCCLEYTFVACRLPNNERFCPREQTCVCSDIPGACCHPNGTCSVVTECDCDGQYLGDGTVCSGVVGACCFLNGTCAVMDRTCCMAQMGIFEGGTCDPPVACCMPDGSCRMVDPQCCVLINGIVDPDGVCDLVQRCCINGTCLNLEPDCCVLRGGISGAGLCGPLLECCLPMSPLCVNDDNFCCQFVRMGTPGTAPCTLQECCLPSGICIMTDPDCCPPEGVPGPGACDALEECCLANGTCEDLEPDCCFRRGGIAGGPGSMCDLPIEACCLPLVAGVGGCLQREPDCCVAIHMGFPDGAGACNPNAACCFANGNCIDDDPDCCPNRGGVPRPVGSSCSAPQACCLNNGTCVMLDPECCQAINGVPQGVASVCSATRACCLPGGGCRDLDPLCCDEAGGIVDGAACPGTCAGGGPNPPIVPNPPHDVKKNRYISFVPNNGGNPVAFQVTLTNSLYFPGSVGFTAWVAAPDALGHSRMVGAPVVRMWPEPVIHVGDCPIHPVAMYDVRAASGITLSAPLMLMTINRPIPRFWCDTVGSLVGVQWTAPQGVVNVSDYQAALQCFLGAATAPPLTWVDVQSVNVADSCVNDICNIADVFLILKGFQGDPYPFLPPGMCGLCPP